MPPRRKRRFRWGRNTHGGCGRAERSDRKHDLMSEENLHWDVATELIRRGWRKNRPRRIAPENVDGMADQLREANQRTHGEQPLTPKNAWWKKTAEANPRTNGDAEHGVVVGGRAGRVLSANWTARELVGRT